MSKWGFEYNCAGGGNNEQQCYTKRLDNTFIENGVLVIQALREDYTGPAEFYDSPSYDTNVTKNQPYTSARLRTKNKGDWRYGRFEVRAKLPSGQGTWPENVYSATSYALPDNLNPANDFHAYAIEWQAGEIRWYVDGAHYATQTGSGWYT